MAIHGQILADGRLIVDNTLLASEAKCSLQAAVRFGRGLQPIDESVTLMSGQAIHKAFEVLFKGGTTVNALWALEQFYRPKWDELVRTTDVALALGMTVDQLRGDRRSYENVYRVVANWMEQRPRTQWPFEVDQGTVEQTFEVVLDQEENIWYSGTPDVGKVRLGKHNYALDHKSTGRMTREWKEGFRTSGQVSGYLWGLEQVTGERYVGMFVNGLELAKVPGSTRLCKDHGVKYEECGVLHLKHEMWPVQRTPGQIDRWKENAVALARQYKKRLVEQTPLHDVTSVGEMTGACSWCACQEWCATGRDEAGLAMRFVEKWWDPQQR